MVLFGLRFLYLAGEPNVLEENLAELISSFQGGIVGYFL